MCWFPDWRSPVKHYSIKTCYRLSLVRQWCEYAPMICLIVSYLITVIIKHAVLSVSSDLGNESEEDNNMERTCDSLLMCIVTVLSHGLRSGGGVGDVLRKPSKEVRATVTRPQALCCMCVHVYMRVFFGWEGVAPAAAPWIMWARYEPLNLFLFQKYGGFAMFPYSCAASALCEN